MAYDVKGRDVCGEYDEGGRMRFGFLGDDVFAEGFDDFFDAAFEGFVFCRCGQRDDDVSNIIMVSCV